LKLKNLTKEQFNNYTYFGGGILLFREEYLLSNRKDTSMYTHNHVHTQVRAVKIM